MVHQSGSTPAWVTPDKHAAFQRLAIDRGLSHSKLLLLLIDSALKDNTSTSVEVPLAAREAEPASQRVTIRLRSGDAEAIAQRAVQREMRAATYLAGLVRAHVASRPPLPRAEIEELKRAVASLSAVGRNLNQLVHLAHCGQGVDASTRRLLNPIVMGVERVWQAVKAHVVGNLESWRGAG